VFVQTVNNVVELLRGRRREQLLRRPAEEEEEEEGECSTWPTTWSHPLEPAPALVEDGRAAAVCLARRTNGEGGP